MKPAKVTRILFSTITNKWYLQLDRLKEIEISESSAKDLISYYEFVEIILNRFESLN